MDIYTNIKIILGEGNSLADLSNLSLFLVLVISNAILLRSSSLILTLRYLFYNSFIDDGEEI